MSNDGTASKFPEAQVAKSIVGYCLPFSVEPGGAVRLMVRAETPGPASVHVVRLRCGDPYVGLDEERVEIDGLDAGFTATTQPYRPGSYAEVATSGAVDALAEFDISVRICPSTPAADRCQCIIGTWNAGVEAGFAVYLDPSGAPVLRVGANIVTSGVPLRPNRWVELQAGYANGQLTISHTYLPSRSPSDRLTDTAGTATVDLAAGQLSAGGNLRFGAWHGVSGEPAACFDGRIENPSIAGLAAWDFARSIDGRMLTDTGPLGLHAFTHQCPARGVTGSRWDGSAQSWMAEPSHYAAVHFHHDDLTDAGWEPDITATIPDGLASGLYAFVVTGPDGQVDRTPFVVRPEQQDGQFNGQGNRVLFLLPTATYLAYANHRMTISGADFFPSRRGLRPDFQYIKDHPQVGLSMYESHPDGSGVMYSSRRRPILNLKPGADRWAFTADTVLIAFLERLDIGFDVLTDEDLHRQGVDALAAYNVVVTGSHPEYWSTRMLDGLERYLSDGGRMMYLGGNGFYWRVSFPPDDEPDLDGIMEVRRAEDGTRGWIAEPGEYHHQWGGEYGGLWRRLGRPPNLVAGIGFAAQGFDRAASYDRLPESFDGRAAWIFDGVEGDEIVGDYGVGGGAAGQEIDRYDTNLGSPPHAVILATSPEHSDEMLRTKEELLATRMPMKDAKIRADMVFFETPNGGGVFSVGSIAWFGALPTSEWNNDIARITENVVRRFADPTAL